MKKLGLLGFVLFSISNMSVASTDYNCMRLCQDSGMMYQYCLSRCSYNHDDSRGFNMGFMPPPLTAEQAGGVDLSSAIDQFFDGYNQARDAR